MDSLIVGRSPQADIVLDDDSVSRNHLRITPISQKMFQIEDLQSSNGTWRDSASGQREAIVQAYVGMHDVLIVGDYRTTVAALLGRVTQASPAQQENNRLDNKQPAADTTLSDEPYSRYVRTDDGRYIRKP